MDITPLVPAGRQIIQGYGPGRFRIAGVEHRGSVVVMPDETRPWAVTAFSHLTSADLCAAFRAEPPFEVGLLGCGARGAALAPDLRLELARYGLTVETMDTGAACRTFNVLMAEGRNVVAALVALP